MAGRRRRDIWAPRPSKRRSQATSSCIEQRTGIDAACWGGNLSLGAKLRGVAGVIIDGPARDIDEARELRLPRLCAQRHVAHRARPHRRDGTERADHRRRRSPSRLAITSSLTAALWSSSPAADIDARARRGGHRRRSRARRWSLALREGTPISRGDGQELRDDAEEMTVERQQSRLGPRSSTPPRSATRWIDSASPASASTSSRSTPASA